MTYKIIRKKNQKRIIIKIKKQQVIVTAPFSVSNKTITEFVESKKDWINNCLKQERILKDHDILHIYGQAYLLCQDSENYILDNEIHFKDQKGFETSLIELASPYLIRRFLEIENKLNFSNIQLNIKCFQSKWGSCNYVKKEIKLNAYLLLFPKEFIDYVIIHEFVHLLVPNHSSSFYNQLEKWMPNYKVIDKKYQIPQLVIHNSLPKV
ncbi:M48 family metallopeptidase [Floccifex sp.]|uniref:M48 family metallopeptidase n=1 Tax=Floccifex sp. TaxID=2815810 RepID=UPI002A749D5E|nr:SprT-like domain-containing protein [Floccifex sp.]MDD7281842.1 DUF45 domain-containing protein [Erysipelotrichaceae bacterium]MDY2957519.1 YgjP-like metallopeptidase domain-containing protein [Floccifex sp.]